MREQKRDRFMTIQISKANSRTLRYGMPFSLPRTFKKMRQVAGNFSMRRQQEARERVHEVGERCAVDASESL